MSTRTEETILSRDGTKLFVRKWSPVVKPVATVVVIHGFLEHGGRYREIAEYWASEHAISTIVYDCRGHGKSSGQRAYCSSMKDFFDDFEATLEYARNNGKKTTPTKTPDQNRSDENETQPSTLKPSLPIFVFCHSFGGLTFLDYARERQVDIHGVIISAPFVALALKVSPMKIMISKLLGSVIPRLPLPGESLNLTHDPEKLREIEEDTVMLKNVTVGWASQCFSAQDRVCGTVPLPLSMPVLYLQAELDEVCSPDVVEKVGISIEQKDKTIVLRKGDYHEMHNEINRHELYVLMSQWMLHRVS